MEAVIAEAPVEPCVPIHYVPQVELRPGRLLVLLHMSVYCDSFRQSWDFAKKLLESRTIHLLNLLESALDSSPNVTSAVEIAYEKMNALLERIVGVKHAAEGFWRVQNSSMVVVVQQGHVHLFGAASGVAILCRDSQDKQLARPPPQNLNDEEALWKTLTKFNYYHKERLTNKDEFLVVGAKHVTDHMIGDFASILKTRVAAFGLVEACKQVAGRCPDVQARSFVCVPLGDPDLFKGEADEPEPPADWVWTGRLPSEELSSDEEEESEDEGEDGWVEPRLEPSRHTHLYPISEENPQDVPPHTTCEKPVVPRCACIRHFSFENYEEPVMICEYNCCSIIIKRGNITKWKVDGNTEAVVHAIGSSSSVKESHSLVSKIIGVEKPEPENLAEAYKNLLSRAIAEGAKHVGIPALFSRSIWSPQSQLEATYREAAEIIRAVIEKLGKVNMGLKEEKQQQLIQVHFVLNSHEVWRAFVAATDLLAHWEIYDSGRWSDVMRADEEAVQKRKPEPVVEEFPPLQRVMKPAQESFNEVWRRFRLLARAEELAKESQQEPVTEALRKPINETVGGRSEGLAQQELVKETLRKRSEEPAKETLGRPADETVRGQSKEPAKESPQEPAKETLGRPADETVRGRSKEPAKETLGKPADETVRGRSKEPAKETLGKPADEIVRGRSKEPAKQSEQVPAKEARRKPANDTLRGRSEDLAKESQQEPAKSACSKPAVRGVKKTHRKQSLRKKELLRLLRQAGEGDSEEASSGALRLPEPLWKTT